MAYPGQWLAGSRGRRQAKRVSHKIKRQRVEDGKKSKGVLEFHCANRTETDCVNGRETQHEETQNLVYDGTCSDLLNADPFIPEIAAAHVIARQMRQQFSNETLAYLTKILRDQARRSILHPQMQLNSPNQALAEQQLDALIEELTK